jgi:hypothetical protein
LPALIANDRPLPSHIATPPGLDVFRPNGTPLDHAVVLEGTLEVAFDPPASGDLLEISAEAGATLEVAGRTVQIPTGSGLQRELVSLELDAPITRLVLRSPRPIRLGHVFVLRDHSALWSYPNGPQSKRSAAQSCRSTRAIDCS